MKKSTLLAAFFVLLVCGRPDAPTDGSVTFRTVSVCSLPGYAEEIDIAGEYAYVADDQGGLQIALFRLQLGHQPCVSVSI